MTTSGTASFTMDLTDIVEEAFARCGAELRSGWDLRTARTSMNLLLAEWANKGINLFTLDQGAIPLVPGQATYDLPTDTVDLLEHVIRTGTGNNQSDISATRISVSTYATIPNKNSPGRPLQIFVERLGTPRVTLWPVPDASTPYTLTYWRMRRIQDAGDGVNTPDMPFRFLPALIAGLAYYLAMKIPGALDRLMVLEKQYVDAFDTAAAEDRERASIRLVPRSFRP